MAFAAPSMHRDTVIGIVGVVILVAAMVGVFTYERSQATATGGDGAGTFQNLTGPSDSGNVAVTETAELTMPFNQTGMTNVTFTLKWTPGAGVDTMRLIVAGPNGTTESVESEPETDGDITVSVPVSNTDAAGTIGVGGWNVVVEFVSAAPGGPVPSQVPPVVPGSTDATVDFTVDSSVQAYS